MPHLRLIVTMLSAILIAVLVLSEFWAYRTITLKTDLIVDPKRKEKMPISLNITFPRVPCYCEFYSFSFLCSKEVFFFFLEIN